MNPKISQTLVAVMATGATLRDCYFHLCTDYNEGYGRHVLRNAGTGETYASDNHPTTNPNY